MSTAEVSVASGKAPSKALHISLWVVQVLLAAAFGAAGLMKSTAPLENLAANMPWVTGVPGWVPRVAGVSEVVGALGLLLPSITRIKPVLTPLAALGLVVVMVLAAGLHVVRGEPIVPNVVLGGIAAFVAWGRFFKAPIAPRG